MAANLPVLNSLASLLPWQVNLMDRFPPARRDPILFRSHLFLAGEILSGIPLGLIPFDRSAPLGPAPRSPGSNPIPHPARLSLFSPCTYGVDADPDIPPIRHSPAHRFPLPGSSRLRLHPATGRTNHPGGRRSAIFLS